MSDNVLPPIIQGGMGAGVSNWRLARAVAREGQLGVVAGTGLDLILTRRLQQGDPGGFMRRALRHFPLRGVARRIVETYYVPGGRAAGTPFRSKPMPSELPSAFLEGLIVAASFVEVMLARRGHDGLVGINVLEKIQPPTLPALYGAMLAGVAVVLVGAGIPRAIPGFLDRFARGEAAELRLDVRGAGSDQRFVTRFDPRSFMGAEPPALPRPHFLAIVSSSTLAEVLLRKASGRIDGFIVEGHTAGGHNAPPRGKPSVNPDGEPVYGTRDAVDLEAMRALGLPFWLAGSYGDARGLARAQAAGATGIQVGTAFAYCKESGLDAALKRSVLSAAHGVGVSVFTDPLASPTGFPIKSVQLEGTLSNDALYQGRRRICDLGYLRHAYLREDGGLGWRCPSEPAEDYVAKGGLESETVGRKCICNGLMAAIGQGQTRRWKGEELAFVTSGDRAANLAEFLTPGKSTYRARDVLAHLLLGRRAAPSLGPCP